jgi:dehydrogenase/reductase SDR family protein 7B
MSCCAHERRQQATRLVADRACGQVFTTLFFFIAALQLVKPVISWLPSAHHFHNKPVLDHFSGAHNFAFYIAKAPVSITPIALFTTATATPSSYIQFGSNQKEISMVSVSSRTKKLFRGQTVLITGASSGLGRSLALESASCGVHTLVLSARNQDTLHQVAQECQQAFKVNNDVATSTALRQELQIHVVLCDLSRPDDVAKLASEALQLCHGRIDVLINNGGISSRSRFVDTQLAVDEQLMQVNFFSGAALAKAVVPGMIQRGFGKIIWVSSVQGLMGIPHRTSYAASKFAVQGYCEALRAELSSQGIDVHVASPGYIRTNLSNSALTGDGTLHGQVDATTAKGASPEKVACQILSNVAAGRADFVVAAPLSAHVAIWLRFLCPSLLRFMLVRRYQKTESNSSDS